MALSEEFNLNFKFGGNSEFLARLESLMRRVDEKFDSVESSLEDTAAATNDAADAVDNLGESFDRSMSSLSRFGEKLKDIAGYYLSFQAAKMGAERVWSFGMQSMDAFSTQERAENQLKGVLQNRGTLNQFQSIKDYAATIQGRSIYGDEAMIKGAGELATYVKGTESLKAMMDLLTNYAAGMTGGGEVSPEQMESLATGLGMAYDGNYMAMRRKGFDTSKLEALDAIVENGGVWGAKEKRKYGDVLDKGLLEQIKSAGGVTEQMRVDALKESLADWDNLSNSVNDLASSALVKFNNKLGDLRENLGQKIYPVFNKLVATIDENMPEIEEMFDSIGQVFASIADTLRQNMGRFIEFGKWLADTIPGIVRFGADIANAVGKITDFSSAVKMLMIYLAADKVMDFTNALSGNGEKGGLHGALAQIMTDIDGENGVVDAFQKFSKSAAAAQIALVGISWGLEKLYEFGKGLSELGDERKRRKEAEIKEKAVANANSQLIQAYNDYKVGNIDENKYRGIYESINGYLGGRFSGTHYNIWGNKDAAKKAQKEQKDAKGNLYQQFNTTNIEQNVSVAADLQKIGIMLNQSVRALIEMQMKKNSEVAMARSI